MTTIPASMALNAYTRAAGMGGAAQGQQPAGVKEAGGNFGEVLKQALNETTETGYASEQKVASLTGSRDGNIVDVVTAVAEAETTLQTVVTVRDKVIAAYQEIMRMPI